MTDTVAQPALHGQNSLLRALVDLRDVQIQKARIQFGNRLHAMTSVTDEGEPVDETAREQVEIIKRYGARFEQIESEITDDIAVLVRAYPIYAELSRIKGIGPMLSAKLLALIADVSTFETVSKLWRFAGYAVIDGAAEKPVKGEKRHYNTRLKTACFLVGTSFLRSGSPYRLIYDRAREHYAGREDWSDMRRHRAAMRKMIKVFLSHLWERWRRSEGLPTRALYVHEQLGHTMLYRPEEFGWGS